MLRWMISTTLAGEGGARLGAAGGGGEAEGDENEGGQDDQRLQRRTKGDVVDQRLHGHRDDQRQQADDDRIDDGDDERLPLALEQGLQAADRCEPRCAISGPQARQGSGRLGQDPLDRRLAVGDAQPLPHGAH
jgi:hypothetical protein